MLTQVVGILLAMSLAAASNPPDRGVSQALARERAAAIRDLRYDLSFTIPAERTAAVVGRVTLASPFVRRLRENGLFELLEGDPLASVEQDARREFPSEGDQRLLEASCMLLKAHIA